MQEGEEGSVMNTKVSLFNSPAPHPTPLTLATTDHLLGGRGLPCNIDKVPHSGRAFQEEVDHATRLSVLGGRGYVGLGLSFYPWLAQSSDPTLVGR